MIPIRDVSRPLTTPHVTRLLILTNVIVFIVMKLLGEDFVESIIRDYAAVPEEILRGRGFHTLITATFLHGGFFHLFGNMIYLHVFGNNVEDSFGHLRYLLLYIACGVVAFFVHALSSSPLLLRVPTIGASGAVSGLLGVYIVLYPRAQIVTVIPHWVPIVTAMPAAASIGFWFVMQLLFAFFEPYSGVAHWAHVGGFLIGMALAPFARRRQRAYLLA